MRKYIFTAIIAVVAIFATVSCSQDEVLTPSGNYSPIRGGFPQGNSKQDSIINEIKKEYGVYLIYKEIRLIQLDQPYFYDVRINYLQCVNSTSF